jgi:hypothetical protein
VVGTNVAQKVYLEEDLADEAHARGGSGTIVPRAPRPCEQVF